MREEDIFDTPEFKALKWTEKLWVRLVVATRIFTQI